MDLKKQAEDRIIALRDALSDLNSYMLDHCPDDQFWEEFDPEVDEIRSMILEEMEK